MENGCKYTTLQLAPVPYTEFNWRDVVSTKKLIPVRKNERYEIVIYRDGDSGRLQGVWILGTLPLALFVIGVSVALDTNVLIGVGPQNGKPIVLGLWLGLIFYSGVSVLNMFKLTDSKDTTTAMNAWTYVLGGAIPIFAYRVLVGSTGQATTAELIGLFVGQSVVAILLAPCISGPVFFVMWIRYNTKRESVCQTADDPPKIN